LVVGVVGTGTGEGPAVRAAEELGALVAAEGWVVVSGGRDAGVMRAVNRGARRNGGLTVGILPGRSAPVAPDVEVAVITDLGNARNNVIVLSSDVVVACGVEGPGTASEVALALKNGKTVILLGADEVARQFFRKLGGDRVLTAATPADAVGVIKGRNPA
jgi:uncharacterized protein (TIGR00725 family)